MILVFDVHVELSWLNVVFVLVDDLGYGDLGCYGVRDICTLYFDCLVCEGVRLIDYYSVGFVCMFMWVVFLIGCY